MGDLAAKKKKKKKKKYVAVLSHSATVTAASVANQKSNRLNNMAGARGIHLTDTSEHVIQSRAEQAKKKASPPVDFSLNIAIHKLFGLETQHIRPLNCLSSTLPHILPSPHALSTTSVACPAQAAMANLPAEFSSHVVSFQTTFCSIGPKNPLS